METRLIDRAWAFAVEAHGDQKRKYTNQPYYVHLREVAELVQQAGGTSEQIAAAYLHDTVEDCNVSINEIAEEFGEAVSAYVWLLTDTPKTPGLNRAKRKELDRIRLSVAPGAVHTIKLADMISNTSTIVQYDADFAKTYMVEKRAMLEVLTRGAPRLYERAKEIVEDYFSTQQELEVGEQVDADPSS